MHAVLPLLWKDLFLQERLRGALAKNKNFLKNRLHLGGGGGGDSHPPWLMFAPLKDFTSNHNRWHNICTNRVTKQLLLGELKSNIIFNRAAFSYLRGFLFHIAMISSKSFFVSLSADTPTQCEQTIVYTQHALSLPPLEPNPNQFTYKGIISTDMP